MKEFCLSERGTLHGLFTLRFKGNHYYFVFDLFGVFLFAAYERGQILTRGGVDSEDEDGGGLAVPQMDPGEYRDVLNQKRGGKKAHQFPSQAAYEEYMSSIEYVPKAAYSYGRRIAGEDFNAAKTKKKPKLNPEQEWKAIEKIIAEKHK